MALALHSDQFSPWHLYFTERPAQDHMAWVFKNRLKSKVSTYYFWTYTVDMFICFQRSYFPRLGFQNPILNSFPHSLFSPQVLLQEKPAPPSPFFKQSNKTPKISNEQNLPRRARKVGTEDNSEYLYSAFILSNLGWG